ncbi:hypothetical protein J0X15_04555 [Roseibium sp. CAU 1637]|uniref:Uncharacterized protein n=1 Tax=Roseibium limicola TaxID=2816037 RepID=A0A939EKW2_9HYPH|nr:hypothetical protein [Roseibium limicola]
MLFSGLLSLPAQAQDELPKPGDTYMISRAFGGVFAGSHKIYNEQMEGLYKVTYCGRAYWVLPYTVAWTQIEVENRRTMKVEYNFGKGWRPLCSNPDQQVSLDDLGIAREAREVIVAYRSMSEDSGRGGGNRFSAIARAFQETPGKSDSAKGSYHAN